MKKGKIILSVLVLLLVMTCCAVLAEGNQEITFDMPTVRQTYDTDTLDDSDELASEFISRVLRSGKRGMLKAGTKRGTNLSGPAANIYPLLYADIVSVANGDRSSTVMVYRAEDIYETLEFTADDLGIPAILDGNQFSSEALEAIGRVVAFDLEPVVTALLNDCPYELYWFDKTEGFSIEYPGHLSTTDGNVITVSGDVTVSLYVSADYSLNNQPYVYDTAYGQGARQAADNAGAIAARYAGTSDRSKLTGFADEICTLTGYNYDALDEGVPYGNPWQLIWVFDGNPDTSVVCEGYAKAYKYLCDSTTFTGDIRVITATGLMSGGTGAGAHMWNVVHLDDGYNYLVDVTNIDDGTIGYPDQLLLAEAGSGSFETGYTFETAGGDIQYRYDAETKGWYSEEELVIALKGQHKLTAHARVEATCSEPGTEAYWSCNDCGKLFSDAEANYEIEEPVAIPAMGHTLTAHPKVDSTCAATGTEAYWSCDVCGKLFSDEDAVNEIEAPAVIGKKAHTLTAHQEVDSTCAATGTEAYWSCDACGKFFSDEDAENEIEAPVVIGKKAHTLTAHPKVDSTCTATGTEAYWNCDACGKLFSDEDAENEIEAPVVIGKKAHTLTAHPRVDSTCTATGTEAYWNCEACGKLFSDENAENEIEAPVVIGKKAHTLTVHTKIDATCTATGTEAYWSCDVCGKLFSDENAENEIEAPAVIGKKAHTLTAHAKVDSTCAMTGTEAYWSCGACGKLFSDEAGENEIDAPVTIGKKAHTLTAHAREDSSCSAAGTEAYWSCSVCGGLFSDEAGENEIDEPVVIEKKAHTLTAHGKEAATCDTAGTEAYWVCEACHELFSDEAGVNRIDAPVIIDALGHDWNTAVYEWSEDDTSITATRVCKHDANHTETETVSVVKAIVSPTEQTGGGVVYTSGEFTNESFSVQTKEIPIPALKDMTVIRLPGTVCEIPDEAFRGTDCQAVIIPDGCTVIGENAFAECTKLRYVRIPASVQDYPENAFADSDERLVIDWKRE